MVELKVTAGRKIMAQFPSLKAKKMLALLTRSPLNYQVVSCVGSHRKLQSALGYPPLNFSFHDSYTLSPGEVREILTKKVGLTDRGALNLI